LLLLTNDGELAQKMTHPSYKMKKIYHATLDKTISNEDLKKIQAGLELEDGPAPVDSAEYIVERPHNEVGITIHIGRNRIVRRIFSHLGYEVLKLDRVYLGGLTKKDLPRGFVRQLTKQEVIMLKHFTGK
jgi:23S rRNA pseudouridine2605 synthase